MFRWMRRLRYFFTDLIYAFFRGRWFTRFFQTRSLFNSLNDFTFGLRGGRLTHFFLGLPAITVVLGASYVMGKTYLNQIGVIDRYWAAAVFAREAGNDPKAALCLQRVLAEGKSHKAEAQFEMASLIEDSGQVERAAALFHTLAPDDSAGSPPAHRRFAIILSRNINQNTSIDELERWHWHLKNSLDKRSPAMAMAWGRYYLMVGDLKEANNYFEKASGDYPQLYQVIGDLNARLGRQDASIGAYTKAAGFLRSEISQKPQDSETRINYAQCLMRLGEFGLARKMLIQGKETATDDNVAWDSLLAALHVNYHDLLTSRGAKLTELLSALNEALKFEPSNGAALRRLMSYSKADVTANTSLREILASVIATGKATQMAHLAMGNLCWIEGDRDQAKFHFGQAQEGSDNMPVVLNNLAWAMAADESPNNEQALSLVNEALRVRPGDPNFLDTRGTIYMQVKQWKKALNDLEAALPGLKDKVTVHRKLALIYDELEIPEVADQHRRFVSESE